jgi:hypothetical protein
MGAHNPLALHPSVLSLAFIFLSFFFFILSVSFAIIYFFTFTVSQPVSLFVVKRKKYHSMRAHIIQLFETKE